MEMQYIILLVSVIIVVAFGASAITFFIRRKITNNFVIKYSVALKRIDDINSKYHFYNIQIPSYIHKYDNKHFYNEISCWDYLVYQIANDKKGFIEDGMRKTLKNIILFDKYTNEINGINEFGIYSVETKKNTKKLIRIEKKLFDNRKLQPVVDYRISVILTLTDINGTYKRKKSCVFYPEDIKRIIKRVNLKEGDFFYDQEIWDSICRVERGKVTNKMRFSIYARDHHRCRICGRTKDLEIDHIIPIAKGGKSTYNNLQTLCHRCNQRKGDSV